MGFEDPHDHHRPKKRDDPTERYPLLAECCGVIANAVRDNYFGESIAIIIACHLKPKRILIGWHRENAAIAGSEDQLSTAGVTRRLREFAVRVNKSNHVAKIKQIEDSLTMANSSHKTDEALYGALVAADLTDGISLAEVTGFLLRSHGIRSFSADNEIRD